MPEQLCCFFFSAPPCAAQAATSGKYVLLSLSTFSVPCPGALVVRNGSADAPGDTLWQLCDDNAPLQTPPIVQVPQTGTLSLFLSVTTPHSSAYSVKGTMTVTDAPGATLTCSQLATIATGSCQCTFRALSHGSPSVCVGG